MRFLALAVLLLPSAAFANHVKVNCGPVGYWDNSQPKPESESTYVWIMNDDTAKLQPPNEDWVELGEVRLNGSSVSINDLKVSEYASGDRIQGANLQLKLDEEFERPNQKKDRRFFRASYRARLGASRASEGKLECVVGLK